ncbi:MAG: membrane dipeptidase [Anaeromyxobacter sp.]
MRLADGHADSLMWNRDLTIRQRRGQVDVPRLRQAGVALQAFTIVTRGYPWLDGFGAFAAARGWPRAARRAPWARCLHQVEALHALAARSGGALALADSAAALSVHLDAGRISAVLGVEGGHALEGDAGRVAELAARGVRFMGLTHLGNNALGGTSTPLHGDRPLSTHGFEVVDALAASGLAVDLAHASPRTFDDVLAHPARPRLLCSHAGIAAARPGWRNLSAGQLGRLADRGGVVGVIFATVYLGGSGLEDVVRHVEAALDGAGEDAVGLGSDFDGMVPMPPQLRDVTGLPLLVQALERRLPAATVEKVAFGNWRRFYGEVLG